MVSSRTVSDQPGNKPDKDETQDDNKPHDRTNERLLKLIVTGFDQRRRERLGRLYSKVGVSRGRCWRLDRLLPELEPCRAAPDSVAQMTILSLHNQLIRRK
jgi:hypothetical protein